MRLICRKTKQNQTKITTMPTKVESINKNTLQSQLILNVKYLSELLLKREYYQGHLKYAH